MGILRLVLAFSVVASHVGALFGTKMLPGNYAVEIFFMISGFYMSLVLSSKYKGEGALWMFYSNRYLRLYPTYFLVLLASWVWFAFTWIWLGRVPSNSWVDAYQHMNFLPKAGMIFANWTMIGNDIRCLFHFSPASGFSLFHSYDNGQAPDGAQWAGEYGTIGQAWSVGLEIWFYLLVPWLAGLRLRGLVCIGLCSALLKTWMECHDVLSYFFFPAQLGYFILGILACRAWSKLKGAAWEQKAGMALIALLLVLAILFPFVPIPGKRWLYYALFAVSLPFVFAASKSSTLDRWLGNLSYPVYLIHGVVAGMAVHAPQFIPLPYLTLILTLVLSILSQRYVDDPLDRWRQRRVVARWIPAG